MNRAEAMPVDGSRSTTEPPDGRATAAPPPEPGKASPPQVTAPVRAAGANNLAVRPTVRLRPPVPALPLYRGLSAVVNRRNRADVTADRLPARRAAAPLPVPRPSARPEQRSPTLPGQRPPDLPGPQSAVVPDDGSGALPDSPDRQPAEVWTRDGPMTRRTGRRGVVAARRVVGL